jgi:hypothetical protein
MDFTASPTDVIKAVDTARKIEGNPVALGARFIGLGADEQRAGVPTWTWIVLAIGVGGILAHRYWPREGLYGIY